MPFAAEGMPDSSYRRTGRGHIVLPAVRQSSTSTSKCSRSLTVGIGRGLDGIQELHCLDIIEVNLVLQHNDKPFPVQLHCQHGRGKSQFAYRGLALYVADVRKSVNHLRLVNRATEYRGEVMRLLKR